MQLGFNIDFNCSFVAQRNFPYIRACQTRMPHIKGQSKAASITDGGNKNPLLNGTRQERSTRFARSQSLQYALVIIDGV